MRKLFSLIAAFCAMAAFGMFAPRANAAQLPNSVLAVKIDQVAVQKARYRCWWRHGYRHCGYRHHRRWWRHHRRHRHWGHHHWRRHHRYLHNRHWRHRHAWRRRYYGHRHYYYRPYVRPVTRQYYRYRPYAYCIGLCWW